jgi:FAD/FMN-containing dehydrogenase
MPAVLAAPVTTAPATTAPATTTPATTIIMPGDPGWDDARRPWSLAVDQHPAAVALPASAAGVAEVIGFARRYGLRVAAQGTGHNAAPLGPLADTILVKTERMRRVSIDPGARIARVEAGVAWLEVVEAAAEHGLAALAGSSPDVGVVGYTIGGGMSWLGRAYGLAANNTEAIEAVTADGRIVRADAVAEPDLFWALRGGGGSFGVVTAIELRLFPITEVYAGLLWWPADGAAEVLQAWRQLTQVGLPDEFTTSARLLNVPAAAADLPAALRGKSFVVIDVIHLGTPAEADRLLAPLRALRPVTDTIGIIPAKALCHLHMDPEQPTASTGDGMMLAGLPAEAIDTMVRVAGPKAGPPLAAVELRHVGGEMKRARPGHGALAAVDADYALFAVGPAPFPQAATAAARSVAELQTAMSPWAARQMYLNLAETGRDPGTFWSPQAYDRLRRIKAAVDPDDLIRSNHPIRPSRIR